MRTERRRWRSHSLVQLTLVRYREFIREPEAVFWVFVFPILLTAGLGIAFRNQAPERTAVAVVESGEGGVRLAEALQANPRRLGRQGGAAHRAGGPHRRGRGTGRRRVPLRF